MTEFVDRAQCGRWIEYTLFKGDKEIAWCIKSASPQAKVSEVYVNSTAEDYREYLNANLWRYPFDDSCFDDY